MPRENLPVPARYPSWRSPQTFGYCVRGRHCGNPAVVTGRRSQGVMPLSEILLPGEQGFPFGRKLSHIQVDHGKGRHNKTQSSLAKAGERDGPDHGTDKSSIATLSTSRESLVLRLTASGHQQSYPVELRWLPGMQATRLPQEAPRCRFQRQSLRRAWLMGIEHEGHGVSETFASHPAMTWTSWGAPSSHIRALVRVCYHNDPARPWSRRSAMHLYLSEAPINPFDRPGGFSLPDFSSRKV
jgi:hypothetical protein